MELAEKDFGTIIDEEVSLISADDLMKLQKEHNDLSEIEFATCSVCSHTCGATAAL